MRQIVFPLVFFLIGIVSSAAYAGDMEPGAVPGSTSSHTLEDIYNRLNDGTAGSPSTFSDPSVGPDTATGHTLDQVMEKAPKKDDTDGAEIGDVKAGKKFWGLNAASGEWGVQTGTASAPRWSDNGDGTVTDTTTGLIWLKDANRIGRDFWEQALEKVSILEADGSALTDGSVEGDWRLPTLNELKGLASGTDAVSASAMQAFTEVERNSQYWTSTSYSGDLADAWIVDMDEGDAYRRDKTSSDPIYGNYRVWPVRAGQ